MRNTMFSILILATCSVGAWGQVENGHAGQGYAFVGLGSIAPGSNGTTVHLGGGGEALVFKGLGAGAEIGYLYPRQSFHDGIGLLSANGSYHFNARARGSKLSPFVTMGYSLAFRNGHANLFNYGGGIHYWFTERVGFRAEFRDHIYDRTEFNHFWGFRFGVAFR